MAKFRYSAYQLDGAGGVERLDIDLQFSGLTCDVNLSGVDAVRFTITPEYPRLQDAQGRLKIVPWKTLVIVELGNQIVGGGIVSHVETSPFEVSIECVGHLGYYVEQPFVFPFDNPTPIALVGSDPAKVFCYLLLAARTWPDANLGLKIDRSYSCDESLNIGNRRVDSDAENDGPYVIGMHNTPSLYDRLLELSELGSFDFFIDWSWRTDGTPKPIVRLIGDEDTRGTPLQLTVGVNILEPPVRSTSDEYFNNVVLMGGGKGRKKLIVTSTNSPDGRLSRTKIVHRPRVVNPKVAQRLANRLARKFSTNKRDGIEMVRVVDHPTAPLGQFKLAQLVTIFGPGKGYNQNYIEERRIVGISYEPETDSAVLTLADPA